MASGTLVGQGSVVSEYAYIPVLHNIKPLHDFQGVIPPNLRSIGLATHNPVVKIRQLTLRHRKIV